MAYLISHIAFSLLFTMLLGLLLGWLLWGYVAQQRAKEVQRLRNRVAEMQILAARVPVASFSHSHAGVTVPDMGGNGNSLIEGELPERIPVHNPFFEDEEADAEALPASLPLVSVPVAAASVVAPPPMPMPPPASALPIAPDLEAEVKEARLQHLQQQVRDLESLRDRLPLLQADLSDALAGRRAAESRYQEAKSDFEVRSSSLLSQIRDFENAAVEWDQAHQQLELEKIATEKELESVKATLRDLQNSQRPLTVESSSFAPTASAIELTDLRERYQRAVKERDAIATELEFWKQSDGARPSDSVRLAELEALIQSKDSQLAEQAARVESLLWHVAELEPFAAQAPQKDEELRRQEAEIAGHMAMHSENAERIRSLQNHIVELQASTVPAEQFQKAVAEHTQRLSDLEKALASKEGEIAEHLSARAAEAQRVEHLEANLQARTAELELAASRLATLEKLLTERDTEISGLLAAHSDMHREMETWKAQATQLEPIAALVPELHDKLLALEQLHQGEVNRLKVNSAQRIRRLRQSITNFKS
jgi:chromosome segregation ATPase